MSESRIVSLSKQKVHNLSVYFLNTINAEIIENTLTYIVAKQGDALNLFKDLKTAEKNIYIKINSRTDGKTHVTFTQNIKPQTLLNIFGIILLLFFAFSLRSMVGILAVYILIFSGIVVGLNDLIYKKPREKILIKEYWEHLDKYEKMQINIKQHLEVLSIELNLYKKKISELKKEFISYQISEKEYLTRKSELEKEINIIETKIKNQLKN